jgi:hypothetical protein
MRLSDFLRRKFANLERSGCDVSQMHEYFGYKNTDNHIRTIMLQRDDERINRLILTITSKRRECDVLESYIEGLPRDVNNYIYSFLAKTHKRTLHIDLPEFYPMGPATWTLVENSLNGQQKQNTDMDPNELYCGGDYSPSVIFDKEILIYVSRLKWFND